MYMNGSILDAEMSPFYEGVTGNVYDVDEKQTYQCVIVGGLAGLPELLRLKRLKGTDEELEEAAAQVEMPPIMQPLGLIVKRVKLNKGGFMKLVCKLAEAQ